MARISSVVFAGVFFFIAVVIQYCGASQYEDGRSGWPAFKETVKSGSLDNIDPSLEGEAVHFTGFVSPTEYITDEQLGVSYLGISLQRRVQIYQWIETVGFTPGGNERRTGRRRGSGGTGSRTYDYYQLVWSLSPVDHTNFNEPEGHDNTPRAELLPNRELQADFYQLEDVLLSGNLFNSVWSDSFRLKKPQTRLALSEGADSEFTPLGLYVYPNAKAKHHPQAGDVRYRYTTLPSDTFSVIGTLRGHQLFAAEDEEGAHRSLCREGAYTAEELVDLTATALVEGAKYFSLVAFLFVYVSMLWLSGLLKQRWTGTPLGKVLVQNSRWSTAAVNAVWCYLLLYVCCWLYNDFAYVVFAVPLIFLGSVVWFATLLILTKRRDPARYDR